MDLPPENPTQFQSQSFTVLPPADFIHSTSAIHKIKICHPAWPRGENVFLQLYALDDPDRGLCHARTVWLAAAIVAGNAFSGYLSRSSDPAEPPITTVQNDSGMLEHGIYYLHVPDPEPSVQTSSPYNYPICRRFRDWWYPHHGVPSWWPCLHRIIPAEDVQTSTAVSLLVRGMDGSCRVSGHSTGTQTAHLCPVTEQDWFRANEVTDYLEAGVKNLANMMLLRADIHIALDTHRIVFVPKGSSGDFTDFVVHFLRPTNDLLPLYNNRRLLPIDRLSSDSLLIRFAWAIFGLVEPSGNSTSRFWKGKGTIVEPPPPGFPSSQKRSRVEDEAATTTATTGESSSVQRKRTCRRGQTTSRAPYYFPSPSSSLPSHGETAEEMIERRELEILAPGLHEVRNPNDLPPELKFRYYTLAIYPGHQRIERLKEQALMKQRPEGFNPSGFTMDSMAEFPGSNEDGSST
ncbi:hypothetical protein PRK78_002381 [Emydomyces testavorans]|uniref:HNH nuclease domain-containing protein n=1 Tax=Emydomyces testavorans TaxID=2070801 RepID=A0AAF0IHI8_9EURO|nr:hypothetical protein PRK78_002381 [Emydomyces testavorans]